MSRKIKTTILVMIIFCCAVLTSCSFEPRSKKALPDELGRVYFTSTRPDSVLSNQLTLLFQSLNVQLVKQPSQAPFSIVISRDNFSYSRPDIVNAALPTSINYSQSATVKIENNKNHAVVASQEFTTSQSVTLNANQIYTSDANETVKHELNRQVVSLVYYWLIASNTQAALHYANSNKTTHHPS